MGILKGYLMSLGGLINLLRRVPPLVRIEWVAGLALTLAQFSGAHANPVVIGQMIEESTLLSLPRIGGERRFGGQVQAGSRGNGESSVGPEFDGALQQIIYFWATWCPDCKEKLTDILPRISERHRVKILTVATDRDLDKVGEFTEHLGLKVKVVADPEKKLRGPLKILSVPSWVVLRRTSDKSKWTVTSFGTGGTEAQLEIALKEAP